MTKINVPVTIDSEEDPDLYAWLEDMPSRARPKNVRRILREQRGGREQPLSVDAPERSFPSRNSDAAPPPQSNAMGADPALNDIPDFDPRNFKFGDPSSAH